LIEAELAVTGHGNVTGSSVSEVFGTGIDESARQQQFSSIGAQIDNENDRKQYFGYKVYRKWNVNNAKQLSVQQIVAFYSGVSTTSRWQCGFQPQLE